MSAEFVGKKQILQLYLISPTLLISSNFTNLSLNLYVPFSVFTDFINLTVTKHNYVPFIDQVSIVNGIEILDGWNFISIPFNSTINKTDILLLHDSVEYTWLEAVNNGLINDFVFGWDELNQSYIFTNTLNPGVGYWLYSSNFSELRMQGYNSLDGYITSIVEKWNIIGVPDVQSLDKNNITIEYNDMEYSWNEAVSNILINDFLFGWDTFNQSYIFSEDIDPGYAYWMYAYHNCILLRND